MRQRGGRHAGAVVGEGDADDARSCGGRRSVRVVMFHTIDIRTLRRDCDIHRDGRRFFVLDGVAEDVVDDAGEGVAVDVCRGFCVRLRRVERHDEAAVGECVFLLRDAVLEIRHERDRFWMERQTAELEARERAQIVHEAFHRAGRAVDALRVLCAPFLRCGEAGEQAVGVAFQQRQRRREVVRDAGDELLALRVVAQALVAGRAELGAHRVEVAARRAHLVAAHGGGRHRRVEVAALDARRRRTQRAERLEDLLGQQARQVEAEAQDEEDGRADDDEQQRLDEVFRRPLRQPLLREERQRASRADRRARHGRRVGEIQPVARPEQLLGLVVLRPLVFRQDGGGAVMVVHPRRAVVVAGGRRARRSRRRTVHHHRSMVQQRVFRQRAVLELLGARAGRHVERAVL